MTDNENKGASAPTSQAFGQSGWLRWVLVGSLAINLFFGGMAVSHFVFNDRMKDGPPSAGADSLKHAFRGYVFSLPKNERKTIHLKMRKSFREIRPEFRKYKNLNERIASLIEVEVVDEKALRDTLEELSSVRGDLELRGRIAIFEQILTFPLEARRKIAENMRRDPRRKHKGERDKERHESRTSDVDTDGMNATGNITPKGAPVGQQ